MKKFSKVTFFVLSFLCIISILTSCTQISLPSGDYTKILEREIPAITIPNNGKFSIMQITDTHLVGGKDKDDAKTLGKLAATITNNRVDLVVMTGDIFDGFNKRNYDKVDVLNKLNQMFISTKQLFTYVAGNNDGEMLGTNQSIILGFSTNPYFVFADTKDVDGDGNFYIKLTDNNGVEKHRLLMIDSRMRDNNGKYIPISDNQVSFFESVALEAKAKDIYISMFTHIPFDSAIQAIQYGRSVPGDLNYIGYKNLRPSNDNGNEELYKAVKESKRVGLIVSGHYHGIDIAKMYDDIIVKISKISGYYNRDVMLYPGVSMITIDTTYNTVKDIYSFRTINFSSDQIDISL